MSKDQWHLNKEVTITQIIAIVSVLGIGVSAWFGVDKRLSILETYPIAHSDTHRDAMNMQRVMFDDMKDAIKENRRILIDEIRK